MTAPLQDLAHAARTIRVPRPPEYQQIITGSRVIRFFAFLCVLVGGGAMVAGVVPSYFTIVESRDELAKVDAESRGQPNTLTPGTSLDSWSSRYERQRFYQERIEWAWFRGVVGVAVGMVFWSAAALLRMVAFSAIALRDVARNSFLARAENAVLNAG